MKRLIAIDAKLIDLTQDAYLWLYDRTGIYVATVAVALVLAGCCLISMDSINLVFHGLIIMGFVPLYLQQMLDLKTVINASARWWKPSIGRRCFLVVMLVLLPSASIGEVFHTVLAILAVGYVQCIQIRDREPKDFFPSREFAGAGA